MKILLNSRILFLFIFLICATSLIGAFYLEYFENMEPCVLCWVQRVMFALIGLFCLIACIHNPQGIGRRIYAFLSLIFSVLGIVAAGRQIWLSFHPGVSCISSSIQEIFSKNTILKAILKSFEGTPECGLAANDKFFGLALPYWGIILFSFFSLVLIFQLLRTSRVSLTTSG